MSIFPRSKKEVDAEIRHIEQAGKEICASKETAMAFMVKHGFVTPEGKTTARYGGKE